MVKLLLLSAWLEVVVGFEQYIEKRGCGNQEWEEEGKSMCYLGWIIPIDRTIWFAISFKIY